MIDTIKQSLFINNDSLKAKAIKGGVWLGAGGGIEQVLRLIRNMILARILMPDVFGLMAIILAVNAALESITQIGVKEAIIQNPHADEDTYLNGAWWLSLGRSVGLFTMGIVSSYWIVDFYHIPDSLGVLQASFIAILFNGSMSARAFIAMKKMEYKKWVIINSGGGIIGIGLSILLSFLLHNVNALVIGFIAEAGFRCLLSYLICPFSPKFRFTDENLKALFAYTRGMFGLPILYLIYSQAAIFVMGRILSKEEVGLYSMALSLAQAPSMLLINIMNQILMPAFSSRQNDIDWLNATIMKSTKLIVISGIPMCFFAALYAPDILTVVYGQQYISVAVPFGILVTATLMATFANPIVNVYLSIGQPKLHRLFLGIRALFISALIYPALRWFGIHGAAIAVLVSMTFSYIFQVKRLRGLTGLDILEYAKIFTQGIGVGLIVVIIWFLTYNNFSQNSLNNLIIGFTGCMSVYCIIIWKYRSKLNYREIM